MNWLLEVASILVIALITRYIGDSRNGCAAALVWLAALLIVSWILTGSETLGFLWTAPLWGFVLGIVMNLMNIPMRR